MNRRLFLPDDRIIVIADSPHLGQRGTVTGHEFRAWGLRYAVRLDTGDTILVDPGAIDHID